MTDIIKFKKSVPTVGKSFRLLDFAVFDERPQKEHSSDEDSGNGFSARRTNTDEAKFMIQMFGVSEKGETCCIFVNDFKPFFYVKVGNSWTHSDAGALLREIKKNVGKFIDNYNVECQGNRYTADHILIATGSRPCTPNI